MENNTNEKEEVLETKEEMKPETKKGWAIVVGTGVAMYMLGRKRGIREGYEIGALAGMTYAGEKFTEALNHYTKELTSKGD